MPILLIIALFFIGAIATHSFKGGLIWLVVVLGGIFTVVIVHYVRQPVTLPHMNDGETSREYRERMKRMYSDSPNTIVIERQKDFRIMTWQEFEIAVQKYFDRLGYATIHRGQTGDKGVDIEAYSAIDQLKAIIQCKHYAGNVGSEDVQKLAGAMVAHQADKAYLVTSGGFTEQAYEFAAMVPGLTLISGKTLAETWEGAS